MPNDLELKNDNSVIILKLINYKELLPGEAYGDFIIFDSAVGTFHSFYSAPCGNDCFRSSRGRYSIIDEDRIRLYLLETRKEGFCGDWKDEGEDIIAHDLDLGVFVVQRDDIVF